MSTEPKRERGKQVSATVSPELYEALDDYGWQNRKKRTDLVRQAVEEFAERNNILQQHTGDVRSYFADFAAGDAVRVNRDSAGINEGQIGTVTRVLPEVMMIEVQLENEDKPYNFVPENLDKVVHEA